MSSLCAKEVTYDLGDVVSFNHAGKRLYGVVTRVYNTRELYHVEVDGYSYSVEPREDAMRRE